MPSVAPKRKQGKIVAHVWFVDQERVELRIIGGSVHTIEADHRLVVWNQSLNLYFNNMAKFCPFSEGLPLDSNEPLVHPEVDARVIGEVVIFKNSVYLHIADYWLKVERGDEVQITPTEVRVIAPNGMGMFVPIAPVLRYWVPNLNVEEDYYVKRYDPGTGYGIDTREYRMARGEAVRRLKNTGLEEFGYVPNKGYPEHLTWPNRLSVERLLNLD